MKVFYSDTHRDHCPPFEVFDGGARVPYLESPDRVDRVLEALREQSWAEILAPADYGMDPLRAVHDADYLEFLANAWNEWQNAKVAERSVVIPSTFALRRHPSRPQSIIGRAGYHVMDQSAGIVEGTWAAVRASANCALAAAHEIDTGGRPGSRVAFALCRPPGHHAGHDYAGGYCFVNNAACAAQMLSMRGRVVVLDIDYHAGNGTQDIFYERDDVLSISIHADPDVEYPYYAGWPGETGVGRGLGFHSNFPLPPGTGDADYLLTLDRALALIRDFAPRHLVVSAGLDIYAEDPLGTIRVSTAGIAEIGRRIAALGLPTALMMEGGYANAMLGTNVVALLEPFIER